MIEQDVMNDKVGKEILGTERVAGEGCHEDQAGCSSFLHGLKGGFDAGLGHGGGNITRRPERYDLSS